jgi:polyferredoxin
MRPRTLIYGGVLALMCIGFVWGLATREPLRVDVLRDRAALAREVEGGMIENVYNLQVMNMSEQARSFSFEVSGLPGVKTEGQGVVEVGPASTQTVTLRVLVPYDAGQPGANPIFFDVRAEDDPSLSVHEESTFLFPR